jgi:hypothetical protein
MRLRGGTVPSNQRAVRLGQRGSQPPPHIQQNPALVRRNMMGDRLFHQDMGHGGYCTAGHCMAFVSPIDSRPYNGVRSASVWARENPLQYTAPVALMAGSRS